jgi:hypothetical protein
VQEINKNMPLMAGKMVLKCRHLKRMVLGSLWNCQIAKRESLQVGFKRKKVEARSAEYPGCPNTVYPKSAQTICTQGSA